MELTQEQQDGLFTRPVINGLHTGLDQFHRRCGKNIQAGEFWLIMASAGAGKTRLVCQLAGNIAARKNRVLLVSSDTRLEELLLRSFCAYRKKEPDYLRKLMKEGDRTVAPLVQFETWVKKVGDHLVLVPYRGATGEGFKEKMHALLEDYSRKVGGPPDVLIVDRLPKGPANLPAREELGQIARALNCVAVGTCGVIPEARNIWDLQARHCEGGLGPETGIIGITSVFSKKEPKNSKVSTVFAEHQRLIAFKQGVGICHIPIVKGPGSAFFMEAGRKEDTKPTQNLEKKGHVVSRGPKLEYQTAVVLSTAHLPRPLAEAWECPIAEDVANAVIRLVATCIPYGYRTRLWDVDEYEKLPVELRTICDWVRENCHPHTSHIIFDCDGQTVEGLPTYEW